MFGYLTANTALLSEEQHQRYQSLYCGLCRAIRTRHGQLCGLSLTYDMTFLILLLGSVYQPEEQTSSRRCLPHPVSARLSSQSVFSDYAADLNVALAYHNLLDDWQDDKNPAALLTAQLLRRHARSIQHSLPRQWDAICRGLEELHQLEIHGSSVDDCCRAFGTLMGELFVWREDDHSPLLRQLGDGLGQFIYLLDAVLDKQDDLKHERFNPLIPLPTMDWRPVLAGLLSQSTDALEQLPLSRDRELLENILYSGVWVKYLAAQPKPEGESL